MRKRSGPSRTPAIWTVFNDVNDEDGMPTGVVQCTMCDSTIAAKSGTSAMWNHTQHCHPKVYIDLKQSAPAAPLPPFPSAQPPVIVVTAQKKVDLNRAFAMWVTKHKRPRSITRDDGLVKIFDIVYGGSYKPPSTAQLNANILLLSGEGQANVRKVITDLVADGGKIGLASDIWSDGMTSLYGACAYVINTAWEIEEWLFAAEPFGDVRHTAENIRLKLVEIGEDLGLPAGNVGSGIEFKANDNAANIVAGTNMVQPVGPGCVAHTIELAVNTFLDAPGIADVVRKGRGINSHFNKSTGVDGAGRFREIQRQLGLPEVNIQGHTKVRWTSGHKQLNWVRVQQKAVQHYDMSHLTKDEVYNADRFEYIHWQINEQSCGVLAFMAVFTQHIQGTKYPTACSYIPLTFQALDSTRPGSALVLDFEELDAPVVVANNEIIDQVRDARDALHYDLENRLITKITGTESEKRLYVATQLHPSFKHLDFTSLENIPEAKRAWALAELRERWVNDFKPKAPPGPPPGPPPPLPASDAGQPRKRPKTTSMFRLMQQGIVAANAAPPAPPVAEMPDELEQYLALPAVPLTEDLNILKWWQARALQWPNLAKMVKQILAPPVTSAGVERVFSAAGRMHSDEQKSATGETLKHALFASFNVRE